MSTALGTALGIGVSKAAGAASKVLQDALSAGYNRITTLEKADIQFRNMGLSAGDTKRQLADLNDIVTGTSTSLADAAAAAAMLGGAGVAAGDDMNNAVKALVNISAASGASAQDIGLVMMQIKASGKLMGSEALQLAQRGVPIYDLIAKSIGKTTAEVRTLGEEGKISFDQVVTAINQGTGNLAKEMGETLPAKLANFRTAMGRLSAAGMEPFLLRAKGGVVGLTEAVNDLTPKMKDFALAADAKIFDQWVPQLKGLYATLEGSGALDRAAETFTALWDSLMELGPAARTIGAALAEASASLGVGGCRCSWRRSRRRRGFCKDSPRCFRLSAISWRRIRVTSPQRSRRGWRSEPCPQSWGASRRRSARCIRESVVSERRSAVCVRQSATSPTPIGPRLATSGRRTRSSRRPAPISASLVPTREWPLPADSAHYVGRPVDCLRHWAAL
ncbi:tape measure protein [Gordonia westfalica]|nr:tape measure protein [Gordonia westfalica]